MSIFFEILMELVIEVFFEAYISLMQLIVPEKSVTPKTRIILKRVICGFTLILLISVFCGLIMFTSDDASLSRIGGYLMVIPLVISLLQIVFGLVMKFIFKKR